MDFMSVQPHLGKEHQPLMTSTQIPNLENKDSSAIPYSSGAEAEGPSFIFAFLFTDASSPSMDPPARAASA